MSAAFSGVACDRDEAPHEPNCVGTAPFLAADGLSLMQSCLEIASWNLNRQEGADSSYGEVLVPPDSVVRDIEVRFLDHDRPTDPVTDRPAEAAPQVACFALRWEVADTTVALLQPSATSPWRFDARGLRAGRTSASFSLVRDGAFVDFRSGPIDIVVAEPGAPPDSIDFVIILNGVWILFVRDGKVVPSCGSNVANPGVLEGFTGEITDGHYSFRRLGEDCRPTLFSEDEYRLAFEFRNPCIASIVNHPEHFGVLMSFHVEGLAVGATEVAISLMRGAEWVYRSPWLPVRVKSGRGTSR